MDLATRAFLLLGIIIGMFVIAGIVLVVGRKMTMDNNGESFDVGKGRKKKRKKPAKKQMKNLSAMQGGPVAGQAPAPADYLMGAAATAPGAFATPVAQASNSAPPFMPPAGAAPTPQAGNTQGTPFGGAEQVTEEW